MTDFNEKVNETFDLAVYLQMMGAFMPGTDFREIKNIVISTYDFLKDSPEDVVRERLPELRKTLTKMSELFIKRFPLKKDISTIAKTWNDLFKNGNEVFSYGITYGWLEELMDLSNYKLYEYVPYQFRIGLVAHKGHFGIEEEFLLKDSFNALVKAEKYYGILLQFGNVQKSKLENAGHKEFDTETYKQITDLKYEVAAFSRLSVISFYVFIESFVNSVGYSFLQRHKSTLPEDEKEILQGVKKGRYLQLKSKIERFQKVIRSDKQAIIITSDDGQIKEPFETFFNDYENLRNSSVHYSPLKDQIWLRPNEWLDKAKHFSELSMNVALQFWRACYPNLHEPEYLGKLDYSFHNQLAIERYNRVEQIRKN
jgi:hypothetical protein